MDGRFRVKDVHQLLSRCYCKITFDNYIVIEYPFTITESNNLNYTTIFRTKKKHLKKIIDKPIVKANITA